jgi:hypothetical protein
MPAQLRRCPFPLLVLALALALPAAGMIAPPRARASGSAGYQNSAEGGVDSTSTKSGDSVEDEGDVTGIYGGQAGSVARLHVADGSMTESGHVGVSAGPGTPEAAAARPRVSFSHTYQLTSGSVPAGTPVKVIAHCRLIYGATFDVGSFKISDSATVDGSATVTMDGATPGALTGDYYETQSGSNYYSFSKTGLFDAESDTMVLNSTVGSLVTISGSIAADAIGTVSNDGSTFSGDMQLSVGVGISYSVTGVTAISTTTGLPAPPASAADSLQVFVRLPPVYSGPTLAAPDPERPAPTGLALRAVTPNPARGSFAYELDLAAPARVTVALFDLQGREVAVLADRELEAGANRLTAHLSGAPELARGIYILAAESEGRRSATKVAFTR